jgi:single-strand DNA-binding protein
MPDLNKVMLMGNLTRDPEVRYTPKGTAVGDLAIAINQSYRTQDGQLKEEVCYVDIVTWGRQAETCKEYLTKGSPIFCEGRLQLDQWETKEGEKKSRLRVRAERIQFLGRGGNPNSGGSPAGAGAAAGAARSSGGESRPARPSAPPPAEADDHPPMDDDIPF